MSTEHLTRACARCPWTQRGQPDLTPVLRHAAMRGEWFCCHTRLGTCHGASRYALAVRLRQLRHRATPW